MMIKKLLCISQIACVSLLSVSTLFAAPSEQLSGTIKIDGSSTVYPITEAVAEEFRTVQPKINVTVGISGTGGGFKKFVASETDISNASRPIKSTEAEAAQSKGIEYVELPVAYDALSVVVNPKNTWATSMTVKELKMLWEPEAQGKITKWSQIRAGWPDKEITLYGAGVDSGTYDYFTEAIVGKEHSSRGDFSSSEDDNTIVQGVANDENALGFFGMAYYEENKSKLKAVMIDDENDKNGKGAIAPTFDNVVAGNYAPLSRPLFVYVRKDAFNRPEVQQFAKFYMENVESLVKEVGYVPLPPKIMKMAQKRLDARIAGSIYHGITSHVGLTLEDLMSKSQG